MLRLRGAAERCRAPSVGALATACDTCPVVGTQNTFSLFVPDRPEEADAVAIVVRRMFFHSNQAQPMCPTSPPGCSLGRFVS
ncbi:hypothetical protein BV25DRAFT_185228 [Artomyces pyxidatus]|uniref:Uncharacterized protein n=1 Tax=Artomyces pyxidatus TaxID=48021 RepID=A0ACB8T9P4_9AGAM|nr:hypothetical protein BV25DRAFT_185228 [Artomyces pyxidatus]